MNTKTIYSQDYQNMTAFEKLNYLAKTQYEGSYIVKYKKGRVFGEYMSGGEIVSRGRLEFSIEGSY